MHDTLEQGYEKDTMLVLLRHGQSTFNEQGLVQGCSDAARLTELGRKQARQAARLLAWVEFDHVFVSPLRRARRTALELSRQLPGIPPAQVRDELRENDLAEWVGRPFECVRIEQAERYRTWRLQPQQLRMRRRQGAGWTEFAPALDVRARAEAFLADLQAHYRGKRLLAIAHGGINRAVMSAALGLPSSHLHTLGQSNCAASCVSCVSGIWRLERLNITASPGELPRIREGAQRLLLLATPELASELGERFLPDDVLSAGSGSAVGTQGEGWWHVVAGRLEEWKRRVLLVADCDVLARLLAAVVGLRRAQALELRPDAYHVVQLPSEPARALLLCVNRSLRADPGLGIPQGRPMGPAAAEHPSLPFTARVA